MKQAALASNKPDTPGIGGFQKTLLVAINSRYTHSNPAVYSLQAWAKREHLAVAVKEYTIHLPLTQLLQKLVVEITQNHYDTIGFSCYIWNITLIESVTKLLKQVLPELTIIWGGPEVGFVGGKWLKKLAQVDYIIAGEGEVAFAALLASKTQEDFYKVPNLLWRYRGQIITNPPGDYLDLSQLPFYYSAELLSQMEHRIVYYESSRGCPFGCHFCISAEEKIRYRDLALVEQDLPRLLASGCKKIKFVDRTFNSDKARAAKLITFLLTICQKGVCFHLELEPSCLDEGLIALLAMAPTGCIQAEIGVQSLYSPALKAIGRGALGQKACANIKKLLAADTIHIHLDLIGGLPYENLETFQAGFEGLYQLKPHYLQLGFLKILPGSVLAKEAEAFGLAYDHNPPYQVLQTPWLSFLDLIRLHQVEYGVDQYYNQGLFANTLTLAVEKWQQQEGLAFEFFEALATFDQETEGGKSLPQKGELLYRFLLSQFPQNQELWFQSLRLDFICKKTLPPQFLEVPTDRTLYKELEKELLNALPSLGTTPKKQWPKEVLLFTLSCGVLQLLPGTYVALLKTPIGVWQQPQLIRLDSAT